MDLWATDQGDTHGKSCTARFSFWNLVEVALILLLLWRNLRHREGKTAATCRPLAVLHALRTVPCSLGWHLVRVGLARRTP